MTVQDDHRDRGKGQGGEAFGAQHPAGVQAEFCVRKMGVETNLREQGLLGMYNAINIACGHTVHLNMDPLFARDNMALPKCIHEVLLIREGVCQGDLASNSKGKVASGNGGPSLREWRDQAPSIRQMAGLATARSMAVRMPIMSRVAEWRWSLIRGPVPLSLQRAASRSGSE